MSDARLQEARRRGGRDDYSCSLRGARQRLRTSRSVHHDPVVSRHLAVPGGARESPATRSVAGTPAGPILFVGERRSPRAMAMGVTWTHGRLSAKTLHEALRAIGLDPSQQLYVNLFRDSDPPSPLEVDPKALEGLTGHSLHGGSVIALGKRVSAYLKRLGIQHVALVHPAARGSIRRTENYQAHVATVLGDQS